MTKTHVSCLALMAALLSGGLAHAGEPLSSLPDRGTVTASDQLPILPTGAPRLQSTTAGAILGFVRNYPTGIWCDGVHDDTAAIQAAINAGGSFDLPPGVCVTSATLTLSTAASHGQVIRGAGATAGDGSGKGKTIIRPTAAVSPAVRLDGSPFGGYLQGAAIEGLTLDMSAMAAGAQGFQQLQAYDIRYARIRVTGDAGKTSWMFGPGAYTTSLNDIQGALVYCLGNGVNNPTTITLVNPDINGLNVEQCASVTTIGGAVQPSYSAIPNVIYLPPGQSPVGFGQNTSGLYVSVGSKIDDAQFFSSQGTDWEIQSSLPATCPISGWPYGTFNDGQHGCLEIVPAILFGPNVKNATLVDPVFAGLYLLNSSGVSGNLTLIGYQAGGGQGNYHNGKETFNAGINVANGQSIFGFFGDGGIQSFLIDSSTGSANFSGSVSSSTISASGLVSGGSLYINPASSGSNFAEIGQFGCFAASTASGSSCFMGSGSKFVGLQDPQGTVESFALDASTGRITSGSGLCPGAGTDSSPTLTGATCVISGPGNPSANLGADGWYYLRSDCNHASGGCIWHKEAGQWFSLL